MLVKHGDIVFNGILFKRVRITEKWNICMRCIFYTRLCCEFPDSLNTFTRGCRSFDTEEFYYIPRGYVSEKEWRDKIRR